MKKNLLFACAAILACIFAGCEPNIPIPDSFPKKHLIEEFTGQDCGFCPYGMDCISAFIENDTNWIVVLHHQGYQPDNLSVAGCKTITSKLDVQSAPLMTINRSKTATAGGNAVVFHPGYLTKDIKSAQASTTYASIVLDNTYDPTTRELKVKVSGAICKEDYPALKLTLLVKESGIVDYQQDFYGTFEGWKEFNHTNAVRAYMTEVLGDLITINKNRRYTAEYSITLNEKWVAENCMVVAFLSEDFNPVVQAEQSPVVANTTGGADIQHGGITAVPVPDYYPEIDATRGPADFSHPVDSMSVSVAQYKPYYELGFNYWAIMTYNEKSSVSINKTACMPFAYIYLFTELNQKEIPTGVYPIDGSMKPGTVYAGYRDDEYVIIDGSTFYYTSKSYFKQDYLVPAAQWLITSGTMTITEDGWELEGRARNGASIHLVGTTAITNRGMSNAPAKHKEQGLSTKYKVLSTEHKIQSIKY
jgi:hypothetical protein